MEKESIARKHEIPDFVAIDFEKMNNNPCSVCEVGLVKYEDGMEVERMRRLVRPKRGLVWSSHNQRLLGHIDTERLKNAPTFEELHQRLVDFIGDKMLVCHNASVDMNYLFYLEREAGVARSLCRHGYADTWEIARKLRIGAKKSLDSVYVALMQRPMEDHHQADADAKACGDVFARMCRLFDYTPYLHAAPYRPKEDNRWDEREYTTAASVEELGDSVSTTDITFEDELLPSFDFSGQHVVVTGTGDNIKSTIRFTVLPKLSSIDQADRVNGKTNVLIIGNTSAPGWRKLTNALNQKNVRPDTFHFFTYKAFCEEMQKRGFMEKANPLVPVKPTGNLQQHIQTTKTYHAPNNRGDTTEVLNKKKSFRWKKFWNNVAASLLMLCKCLFTVCLASVCVVLWLCGIPVKK